MADETPHVVDLNGKKTASKTIKKAQSCWFFVEEKTSDCYVWEFPKDKNIFFEIDKVVYKPKQETTPEPSKNIYPVLWFRIKGLSSGETILELEQVKPWEAKDTRKPLSTLKLKLKIEE